MARTQVQSELIATNAISGTIIADNAITATHIATNSISGTLVQDSGIVTSMIAANNVTAAKIVSDGVETRHLHSNVISGQSTVTAASGDFVLIGDTSDSDNLKKALVSDFGVSGISSSADATAITINSSEQVGIGVTDPDQALEIGAGGKLKLSRPDNARSMLLFTDNNNATIQSSDDPILIESANFMAFNTNGANERMRIDTSGNLFLNTTSAMDNCFVSFRDHSDGEAFIGIDAKDDSNVGIRFGHGGTRKWVTYSDPSDNLIWYSNAGGAERMRINSNGTLMVGTATNATYTHKAHFSGNANIDGIVRIEDVDGTVALSNAVLGLAYPNDNDATNGYFIYMTDGNGAIGSISVASATSVNFNTTSDERLKKNIVDASSQLDTIKNIKVREFDWKKNDYHELGVIAQEIKSIVPNAVTEGGDNETERPFGVDYGKIVPYLIKAVQEQQTIIDDLKSRVETLEG